MTGDFGVETFMGMDGNPRNSNGQISHNPWTQGQPGFIRGEALCQRKGSGAQGEGDIVTGATSGGLFCQWHGRIVQPTAGQGEHHLGSLWQFIGCHSQAL